MNLLLDTHTFIWFLEGSYRLIINALNSIQAGDNLSFISIASIWEIAVKISIGKLEMQVSFDELNTLAWQNGIEILPIGFAHTQQVAQMPFLHKDPFDRIIIAQGMVENMHIVTADGHFGLYTTKIIW